MSWNHRVIKTDGEYALHECFYEQGAALPHSWTADPVTVEAESLRALRGTLIWMTAALRLPVLEAYMDGDVNRLREVL